MTQIPSTVDVASTPPVRTFLETIDATLGAVGVQDLTADSFLADVFALGSAAVTQAVTIALTDAAISRITYTTNATSTVNPPTPVAGQRITVWVINTSGGAMGAITWGTGFNLAGSFTNPANNNRRNVTFESDGLEWYELSRSAADVPN